MFGGAFEELLMQDRIDQRRAMLDDRQDGFRRRLERPARAVRGENCRRRTAHGRLGSVVRSMRSAIWTARTGTPADTDA